MIDISCIGGIRLCIFEGMGLGLSKHGFFSNLMLVSKNCSPNRSLTKICDILLDVG